MVKQDYIHLNIDHLLFLLYVDPDDSQGCRIVLSQFHWYQDYRKAEYPIKKLH